MRAGPRKLPALATEPVTEPSPKATAVSTAGSSSTPYALGFCPGSQLHQLADVTGSAGRENGATFQNADSGLDFRHLGLEVSIMVSTQDVTEILRKSVSWHKLR